MIINTQALNLLQQVVFFFFTNRLWYIEEKKKRFMEHLSTIPTAYEMEFTYLHLLHLTLNSNVQRCRQEVGWVLGWRKRGKAIGREGLWMDPEGDNKRILMKKERGQHGLENCAQSIL